MPPIAPSRERRPPQDTSSSPDERGGGRKSHSAHTHQPLKLVPLCEAMCPPHLTLSKALLFRHPPWINLYITWVFIVSVSVGRLVGLYFLFIFGYVVPLWLLVIFFFLNHIFFACGGWRAVAGKTLASITLYEFKSSRSESGSLLGSSSECRTAVSRLFRSGTSVCLCCLLIELSY